MIDGLATAIPGAVVESVQAILGNELSTAIDALVRTAVTEGIRVGVQEALALTATVPESMHLPSRPYRGPIGLTRLVLVGVWGLTGRLHRWVVRRAIALVTRLSFAWKILHLVGASAIRSATTLLWMVSSAAGVGMMGYHVGQLGAAILLGLAVGWIVAMSACTAPALRLFVELREKKPSGSVGADQQATYGPNEP